MSWEMDGDKTVRIDGISKVVMMLAEESFDNLKERMKRRAYHPKHARGGEISKNIGKPDLWAFYIMKNSYSCYWYIGGEKRP